MPPEAAQDPGIPPRSGKCLLLSIPGELRNAIYEHVLTVPGGIHFRRLKQPGGGTIIKWAPDHDTQCDVNQLKYICRKMKTETANMELKYNELHFCLSHGIHTGALEDFLEYLSSYLSSSQHHTSTIACRSFCDPTLEDKDMAEALTLINFCKAHSNVHIKYYAPYLEPNPNKHAFKFVFEGVYLNLAFRGKDLRRLLFLDPTLDGIVEKVITVGFKGKDHSERNVPNFRFYPVSYFDEDKYQWYKKNLDLNSRWTIGEVDRWAPYVRDWFLNGI